MAKKTSTVNTIWKILERNADGETKVLTMKAGRALHHIVVFTNIEGNSTSSVVVTNEDFTWPEGEVIEIPAKES